MEIPGARFCKFFEQWGLTAPLARRLQGGGSAQVGLAMPGASRRGKRQSGAGHGPKVETSFSCLQENRKLGQSPQHVTSVDSRPRDAPQISEDSQASKTVGGGERPPKHDWDLCSCYQEAGLRLENSKLYKQR